MPLPPMLNTPVLAAMLPLTARLETWVPLTNSRSVVPS
jgi:hypothetical protein